jgi:hypothetical protein
VKKPACRPSFAATLLFKAQRQSEGALQEVIAGDTSFNK